MAQMNVVSSNKYENGVFYYGFNQNQDHFVCGMDDGYRIYFANPLREKHRHSLSGVLHVDMLLNDQYLVFVGDGTNPNYPPKAVAFLDCAKEKPSFGLLFKSDVKGIKVKRDRLIVILESTITVFVCSLGRKPKFHYECTTAINPKGIFGFCSDIGYSLLAYPSSKTGYVKIINFVTGKTIDNIFTHASSLSCIALNNDGTKLATASEKGTLIRIFDIFTGEKINELRRGASYANIHCINFSEDSRMLCVSSDHGTIHLFYVEAEDNDKNTQTRLYLAGYFSNYFRSKWSFCRLKVPKDSSSICVFRGNKIIAICADGSYYKFSFTPKGESDVEVNSNFLTLPETLKKKVDENEEQGRRASASSCLNDLEKEVKKSERLEGEPSWLSVWIKEYDEKEKLEREWEKLERDAMESLESPSLPVWIKEYKNMEKNDERRNKYSSLSVVGNDKEIWERFKETLLLSPPTYFE